jgi:ubiquinol-cytochrome c reductase subunit 8
LSSFHIGDWGNPYEGGGQPGRGVISYGVSPNRLRPFNGFFTKGIFNSIRRVRGQVLYIVPPFIAAYSIMQWAIERYVSGSAVKRSKMRLEVGDRG